MLSSARNSARTSGARQSGPPRFARVILVLAWAVFWLNTALFPCCEVVAAILGGHAEHGSQSVSATQPAHHSGTAHAETSDHSPDSPCSDTLISALSVVGGYEILIPERAPLAWFAVDTRVALSFVAEDYSAYPVPREWRPPPPLRFYLRTQRLLI